LHRHGPDGPHCIRSQGFDALRIKTQGLNGFASFPKGLDVALPGDHVGVGRAKNGVVSEHAAKRGELASLESFGEALVQTLNNSNCFIFGHERPRMFEVGNNGMPTQLARFSIAATRPGTAGAQRLWQGMPQLWQ
jgi:hypothetical protein